MLDFIRIGCAVPNVYVADVEKNTQEICKWIEKADENSCDVLLFPELSMTGYTCSDLFFQQTLLDSVKENLNAVLNKTVECPDMTVVIGLPVMLDNRLYNCAAVLSAGEVKGISVKTFIPNYEPSSEGRWFSAAENLLRKQVAAWELGVAGNYNVPVGNDLLYRLGDGAVLGVEICEDLFAPVPVSSGLCLGGAEVIVNLAASHEFAGKHTFRRDLVKSYSRANSCVYAFCSSGATESTQDLLYSGHSLVAQNGKILKENKLYIDNDYLLIQDADLGIVRAERSRNTSFRDSAQWYSQKLPTRLCPAFPGKLRSDGAYLQVAENPFLPEQKNQWQDWCQSVFDIQVEGLKRRLQAINACPVVGISGGLDSTLALLVATEAVRRLGKPASDVHGITMPCYGTSDRTYQNAWELMRLLGITAKEINIRDAVAIHFRDIDHDPENHDTTYENAQARERTQILMDYAGRVGGIVVGTGDLSELALGWCTYNGDHMSMYSVNGSVPKTLISKVIEAVAATTFQNAAAVLADIVATPISPELLPPDASGKISQQTEDLVGPYALHDFFIYYVLRYGFAPEKIYALACKAFRDTFDGETIKKWLKTFYRRFFTQQFKRNCQPDGVRTGAVGIGPRGDFKMPSDATAAMWLASVEKL